MTTVRRRLPRYAIGGAVGHYAAGGPASGAYAKGLPAAAPPTGFPSGPESNAAGSWGAAANQGIPGDQQTQPAPATSAFSNSAFIQPNTPGNYGSYSLKTAAPKTGYNPTPGELPASNLVSWGGAPDSGISGKKGGSIPQFDTGGGVPDPGGAIPADPEDPGDVQDTNTNGNQNNNLMNTVRQAISGARARYGLNDQAFQQFSDALSGDQQTAMNIDNFRRSTNIEDDREGSGMGAGSMPQPKPSNPDSINNGGGGNTPGGVPWPYNNTTPILGDNDSDDTASADEGGAIPMPKGDKEETPREMNFNAGKELLRQKYLDQTLEKPSITNIIDERKNLAHGGAIPMEAAHGGPVTGKKSVHPRTRRREMLPAAAMGDVKQEL